MPLLFVVVDGFRATSIHCILATLWSSLGAPFFLFLFCQLQPVRLLALYLVFCVGLLLLHWMFAFTGFCFNLDLPSLSLSCRSRSREMSMLRVLYGARAPWTGVGIHCVLNLASLFQNRVSLIYQHLTINRYTSLSVTTVIN
jgi:hypothetical protein